MMKEFKVLKEIGAEMKFTHEIVFSSTELLNKHFNPQISTDERNKQNESMASVKSEENVIRTKMKEHIK